MIVFLLHALFSTAFAFIFSWIFGALTPTIAVVSFVFGTLMARSRARALRRSFPDLRFFKFASGDSGALEAMLTILILYVCARHFLWLLFQADAKLITLHANNYGDLPLHINYIREMAAGLPFPPINPSFASEPLRYPFGPDLYNALWESLGVPLSSHLFIVGMLCSVASLTVLRWFGGWWAVGAFFLSGGVAGWSVFAGTPVAGDLLQGLDWKNLFLSVYITQRGVLFALPAALLLIEASRRIYEGDVVPSKKTLSTLGLVWGWLPLFHLHAFVIASLIMGLFALRAKRVKEFLTSRMAVVAYLPAIYFVLRSSDAGKKSSVIHWDGWWMGDAANAWHFMWLNFGPWLLLPFAIAFGISRTPDSKLRRALWLEFAIYSGLFIFFFNVMLAPWSWDNIKVLIFPYLGFARLGYAVLDRRLPGFAKYAVAFVLFFSGFLVVELSLAPPIGRGQAIYNTPLLGVYEGALAEVPMTAVLAAAPTHDHSITYLGRLRAVGYEGHLWSHGIDYKSAQAEFNVLMRTPSGADYTQLAHDLGVTHIVWGPSETAAFMTEPAWPVTFRNVSRVPSVKVYEVPR